MPRYIVERSFADPAGFPVDCTDVVERNADIGVTWLCSYVRDDRKKSFCVYEAPSPEAVRRAAERSKLPVDRITRVTVLDPHAYGRKGGRDA
jgi:hypothetical protein